MNETRNGIALLPVVQAETLLALGKGSRRVFRTEELSAAELQAIAASEVDPSHDHLDDELK